MWNKKFEQLDRKKFLHLIDYIIEAIDSGKLEPGQSLPTQRELSKKLNLSIGTITKAFRELEKMGYLTGEIGRGTFVRDITADFDDFWYSESKVPYQYNLGHFRTTELFNHTIQLSLMSTIKEVSLKPNLFFHLNDANNCGSVEQRESLIPSLRKLGLHTLSADTITLLTAEFQTVSIIVSALTEKGDAVMMEQVGDRMTRDQIVQYNREVVTVKIDDQGIIPEDLERVAKTTKSNVLVTFPTFQNPTGLVTGLERKKAILSICEKYQIKIIEDGKTDWFLSEQVNPYHELNPNIGIYVTGLYFHINPSASTSVVIAAPEVIRRVEGIFKLLYWTGSHFLLELSSHLMSSGKGEKIIEEKTKLLNGRNKVFNSVFGEDVGHPHSVLRWLKIPESWSSSELTQTAFEKGILIRNSSIFQLDDSYEPPFVRICNGAIHNDMQHQEALSELSILMKESNANASNLL